MTECHTTNRGDFFGLASSNKMSIPVTFYCSHLTVSLTEFLYHLSYAGPHSLNKKCQVKSRLEVSPRENVPENA